MDGRPISKHYDSLQEALAGIAPASPDRTRSPFMPVRRGATPGSPLTSKHSHGSPSTHTTGPLAPLTLNNLSRLPPNEIDPVEASPTLRVKASVAALSRTQGASTPIAAPIAVRARVTPAANVRRKVHLPGAERADPPPTPRARVRSAAAPKAFLVDQTPVRTIKAEPTDPSVDWQEPYEDEAVAAGKDTVLVCVRYVPSTSVDSAHSPLGCVHRHRRVIRLSPLLSSGLWRRKSTRKHGRQTKPLDLSPKWTAPAMSTALVRSL